MGYPLEERPQYPVGYRQDTVGLPTVMLLLGYLWATVVSTLLPLGYGYATDGL